MHFQANKCNLIYSPKVINDKESLKQCYCQCHNDYINYTLSIFREKLQKFLCPPFFLAFFDAKTEFKTEEFEGQKKGQYYVTVSIDSKSQLWRASAQQCDIQCVILLLCRAQCVKITEKVSFNIASELSYIYIGNTKNRQFLRIF